MKIRDIGGLLDLTIDSGGEPTCIPDDTRIVPVLKLSAEARAKTLNRDFHSGNQWAGLEAFLLLASLREWETRNSASIVDAFLGEFSSLPTEWSDDSIRGARGIWQSVGKARSASERLSKPRNAEDISNSLQELLGAIFLARSSAKVIGQ